MTQDEPVPFSFLLDPPEQVPGPPVTSTSVSKPEAPRDLFWRLFGNAASMQVVDLADASVPEPLRGYQSDPQTKQVIKTALSITCGKAELPVCAIGFLQSSAIRAFQERNPALQAALVTYWYSKHGTMYLLWLRTIVDSIPNTYWNNVFWFACGNIPVATDRARPDKYIVRKGPLLDVEFRKLKWPDALQAEIDVLELEKLIGHPYIQAPGAKTLLNKPFWAHFLTKKLSLQFDPQQRIFVASKGTDRSHLADEQVMVMMQHIFAQVELVNASFPKSVPPRLKRQILTEMKIVAAVTIVDINEGLNLFLRKCVKRGTKGSSVTTEELFAAYRKFCDSTGVAAYSVTAFCRRASKIVTTMYGVLPSHDLKRPNSTANTGSQRGFRRLSLKEKNEAE